MAQNIQFTKSHQWVIFSDDGDSATVGITDYAQQELGDIQSVNLPEPGEGFMTGDVFGDLEGDATVLDLYMPLSGTIAAINDDIVTAPESVNDDPYEAWFVEVTNIEDVDELLSEDEYLAFIQSGDE